MVTRIYTVPGRLYWDDTPETEPHYVFIFTCDPYREQVGLHPYHKRRRSWAKAPKFGTVIAWAKSQQFRRNVIAGKNRTRQVERWCQLSGFRCEVK